MGGGRADPGRGQRAARRRRVGARGQAYRRCPACALDRDLDRDAAHARLAGRISPACGCDDAPCQPVGRDGHVDAGGIGDRRTEGLYRRGSHHPAGDRQVATLAPVRASLRIGGRPAGARDGGGGDPRFADGRQGPQSAPAPPQPAERMGPAQRLSVDRGHDRGRHRDRHRPVRIPQHRQRGLALPAAGDGRGELVRAACGAVRGRRLQPRLQFLLPAADGYAHRQQSRECRHHRGAAGRRLRHQPVRGAGAGAGRSRRRQRQGQCLARRLPPPDHPGRRRGRAGPGDLCRGGAPVRGARRADRRFTGWAAGRRRQSGRRSARHDRARRGAMDARTRPGGRARIGDPDRVGLAVHPDPHCRPHARRDRPGARRRARADPVGPDAAPDRPARPGGAGPGARAART